MRKLIFTIACILTIGFVNGQSAVEKEVADAVTNLHNAMIAADKAKLTSIVVDELSYAHSSGLVENKEQFLESLVSGKSDFVTIDISEQQISISGNTAIVRHKLKAAISDGGKPADINLRIMQVWVKTAGGWKLFGRQGIKII